MTAAATKHWPASASFKHLRALALVRGGDVASDLRRLGRSRGGV